jgi:hypothetical protein
MGVRRTAALGWSLASMLAFSAVAWRADGAFRGAGYPAPVAGRELEELDATLDDYRRIYQDFFATGGEPALLNEFPATRGVKHVVFRDLGFLRDASLVHVHDLATARIVTATATARDRAEVVVFEEWNTELQHAKDRSAASRFAGLGQAFRYTLVRDGARWLVAGWDLEGVPSTASAVVAR